MKRFPGLVMSLLAVTLPGASHTAETQVPTVTSSTVVATASNPASGSEAPVTAPEATSPDGKIWMRLHLAPGQVYAGQMTFYLKRRMIQGKKISDTLFKFQTSYFLRVLDSDKDGNVSMRLTYSSFSIDGLEDGKSYIFDTAQPSRNVNAASPPEGIPIEQASKALIGKDLIVRFSPTGEYKSIEGIEKLIPPAPMTTHRSGNTVVVTQPQPGAREFIKVSGFRGSDSDLKSPNFMLPAQLIGNGDSWETLSEGRIDGPEPTSSMDKFKVLNAEQGIMTIATHNFVKRAADRTPHEKSVGTFSYPIWLNGEGKFRVDARTGWTLGSQMSAQAKAQTIKWYKGRSSVVDTAYLKYAFDYQCLPLATTPQDAAPSVKAQQ